MSESPANKIMATIESARISRRQEEGPRFFALVSMPITGNEQIVLTLMKNIHNPIELGFGVIQASLPETFASSSPAPETETVDMTVDGQPAKVTRSRRQRNGAAPDPEPSNELQGESTGNALADSLIEESRREPASEDEAREQAEAEAALAARSE